MSCIFSQSGLNETIMWHTHTQWQPAGAYISSFCSQANSNKQTVWSHKWIFKWWATKVQIVFMWFQLYYMNLSGEKRLMNQELTNYCLQSVSQSQRSLNLHSCFLCQSFKLKHSCCFVLDGASISSVSASFSADPPPLHPPALSVVSVSSVTLAAYPPPLLLCTSSNPLNLTSSALSPNCSTWTAPFCPFRILPSSWFLFVSEYIWMWQRAVSDLPTNQLQ